MVVLWDTILVPVAIFSFLNIGYLLDGLTLCFDEFLTQKFLQTMDLLVLAFNVREKLNERAEIH